MPEVAPVAEELLVVAVGDLLRRDALLLGADGDRRAVLVAARDHQDVVAAQALEAGEDVGRQVHAGQVADVQRAVGVRPGRADEEDRCRAIGEKYTAERRTALRSAW